MDARRVVVTGIGVLTPIGNNLQEYWEGLVSGQSGAAPITLFDATNFKTQFACEVKNFNPTDFLDRKEARKLDRFCQFAMVVANEAFKDSGLDVEKIDSDRAGVIWGSGIGGMNTFYTESVNFGTGNGTPRFNPFFIPKLISDIPAGHISIKYGFRGPNFTTVSACASSTNALIDAFNYIKWNKADIFIAGGSEACVYEPGIGGFNAMMALSTRNDDPKTASRPFDKDRDGFVMGEGAGAIVLEEYEHAKKRGATIYAEVVGGGLTADAHHITAPHPEGLGASNVMRLAIEDANAKISDIDYINVHGTSTPLGDIAETKAIKSLFGEHAYNLNISATKSMTGHLLGAAGVIESIACIMAVKENTIPPTINHKTDDPEIDDKLNLTFNRAERRTVNYALSNTFGFGGHNASVVFKKR
ncbi:MAG TPA: beta-ketoacyl-[acyl-carrier-protein] synthase II [Flavobacteriales bacterium]|jgi:3-oxoacyl-[acyl-carrier-protein] synthase II|nr:beta-ketoacyl-[acyl-carrier-protein] synthase II [Flavobacteriales bacterium]HIK62930.1 beta-ketoacyl-[acyl-carrier-protein] synthase II [Flavobacteriales bacterium]|tara:strand:- start:1952 stop:3199 length:1248 start_codon:yes stop_codon:yes gene_type:complete